MITGARHLARLPVRSGQAQVVKVGHLLVLVPVDVAGCLGRHNGTGQIDQVVGAHVERAKVANRRLGPYHAQLNRVAQLGLHRGHLTLVEAFGGFSGFGGGKLSWILVRLALAWRVYQVQVA